MSQEINSSLPTIDRGNLEYLQKSSPLLKREKPTESSPELSSVPSESQSKLLDGALAALADGRKFNDDRSIKAFSRLADSLAEAFSGARRMSREEAGSEMREGGMRRLDRDLRNLFKGLGMPPQMAKYFSRSISEAMQQEDVEQISFSMTSTRSFSLNYQEYQEAYLANGDGRAAAASVANSFQISALQMRTFDMSINLRTGEFSLNQTQVDALSLATSSSAALASVSPASDADQSAQMESTALAARESSLQEIIRVVNQSAIMQMQPPEGADESQEAEEELYDAGLNQLQQLVDNLAEITGQVQDLFDTMVEIRDLRIEQQDEDPTLRFTLDAQLPVGLTVTDDEGRENTLFPRDDGQLGLVADEPVNISA